MTTTEMKTNDTMQYTENTMEDASECFRLLLAGFREVQLDSTYGFTT